MIVVLVFVLASCQNYSVKTETALEIAGDNRKELEKVLEFYSTNSKDSLKFKATVFLIENMPYHFSYKYLSGFEKAFDSIGNLPKNNPKEGVVKKILKQTAENTNLLKPELISDCQQITSKYLIQTIEMSFMAWNKIPPDKRASFDDFCNFILPYKTGNEPIEEEIRQKLIKKYSWVHKSLNSSIPLKTVVDSVASEFKFKVLPEVRKFYPQTLSINQVEKIRFGLCEDGVNYLVNVFRSLGIVAATDLTPHWGNHPAMGHNWLYVKYGKEEYSTDVIGKIDLKKLYINESIPKVSRTTYSFQESNSFLPLSNDVTKDYVGTANFTVQNLLSAPHDNPVLCVYDFKNEWTPVTYGTYQNDNFSFNDIGVNVLYLAASKKDNELIPINHPFFVDKSKKIHYLKPTQFKIDTVLLTRKCRLSSPRNRKNVLQLLNSLNGTLFQGANKADFSDAETIYKIANYKSNQLRKIAITSNKKFKYVRFYSNGKKTSLARLAFYDDKGQELRGEVIQKNIKNFNIDWSAFDKDPLSYSGGKDFSLGFALTKPTTIRALEFQLKNDMNHIVVGNEYELFYWDKHWKTLGIQIAKDTLLRYANVPDNALFWLKNNEGGKEEQVFIIDKNKRQHWPGSDNY